MNYIKILLTIILVFSNYSNAQISSRQVDKIVKEAMETFNVAGIAVGIVKDGKVVHSKGYGVKSIETNEPVNEHTNFGIASNTKAFTTAALSILVDEDKLFWDDKVVDHIPEFKMYNEYVTQNFNIVDLITHRSGLGLGAGDLMWWLAGTNFTINDILTNFQYFEPKSAFRTKYDYDNNLYIVAGEIIARASGVSWEEYIENNIFIPLEMNNSFSTVYRISNRDNIATRHNYKNDSYKTITYQFEKLLGAAGSIFSTADDMCKWMIMHLNNGKYGDSLEYELFSTENHREMWRIHTVLDERSKPKQYNSHFYGYGLGWFLFDVNGNLNVSHAGGGPGMISRVVMIPDINLGIVLLTNTDTGRSCYMSITRTIMDRYLELDEFDWFDFYYKRNEARKSKSDSVTTKVWNTVEKNINEFIYNDDYIGVYEDKWFGKAEVFLNDGQLWFKFNRSLQLNGPMYYYKGNAFAIKWKYQDMNADAFAIFSLDEEGKAQSIKMKGISPNIDFSFDFQDLDLVRVQTE